MAKGKDRIQRLARRKRGVLLRVLPGALPDGGLPLSAPARGAQGRLGQICQGQPAFCRPEGRTRLLHLWGRDGEDFAAPF